MSSMNVAYARAFFDLVDAGILASCMTFVRYSDAIRSSSLQQLASKSLKSSFSTEVAEVEMKALPKCHNYNPVAFVAPM